MLVFNFCPSKCRLAFLDLARICQLVFHMISIVLEIVERYGFSARIEKCKLIGRRVECHGGRYNANPEGHILLGCPVGTPRYRRDTCSRILEDMVAPAAALQRVSRQTAYSHFCVNARPNYLCRVIARQNAGVGPFKAFGCD